MLALLIVAMLCTGFLLLALPDLLRCMCLPRSIISLQDETGCCNEMWFGRRRSVLPAAKLIFENFGCGHAAIDLVSIQRVCWDNRER